ncbi:MAG: phosphate ABC transporter ATP-binding protein PstB [Alkalibacterium gilvum]|uniref:Phosphate transport system ATP-binding protein n=1 Tax=Alkalibacterium gilvum TaxID=1130080 RepID=A0A1H6U2H3_9LACT|nr:phosphate ABC transporter ATP-binding protein PstB [Alkalibacterium gilvum]MDN6294241.1 phosphate ABC transporter ATP-binding protein PstB [Alkalibacterium sp.]MDN6398356.1 phosphate ABC transporter ATP-binding protein PstB [Alkalibacterium sp.]MDN6408869.1 phosphate ABC transporter ATP-binding protein PstB [Tetragenococcus halophilus]SEI83747.1 phosphate transport system ATP-binding protein [Alkalibacterium gilvum]
MNNSENKSLVYSIKDLNLWYGDTKALKNISIDIPEKEVIAIIGPSGCGKSTFIKTLNRMVELVPSVKTEGSIHYKKLDIKKAKVESLRTEVGMVFQKPNPFPKSIYDNIAYGPRIHGIKDKKTLDEVVERSLRGAALWEEVKDRLDENAFGLSGGQQQRVCIARALAVEPDVILMDEPTSALDPLSTAKIEDLIHELRKNYSIIIVTHNMQQAARISDKTAFFLNGEVIEFDATERMYSNPKDKRTDDYISGKFG